MVPNSFGIDHGAQIDDATTGPAIPHNLKRDLGCHNETWLSLGPASWPMAAGYLEGQLCDGLLSADQGT